VTQFSILTNLKRQHRDLVELSGELLSEAEADSHASYSSLLNRLSLFEGKLKIHLSMEDKHLYPELADHPSESVRNLTGDYIREMSGIYDRFNAFVLRWRNDTPPEGFPVIFIEELKEILKTIYTRIGREEEVLFPLLEEAGADLSKEE
jgi:hemerythrin-like domain-containing protein